MDLGEGFEEGGMYRKRHSQNVEIMKGIRAEMKWTNSIIQDVVDQQKVLVGTGKSNMALPFVSKDSERYAQLVKQLWQSKEGRTADISTMSKNIRDGKRRGL